MQRAVQNANEKIIPHLIGLDVSDQGKIDYTMLNLCQNAKETLGGNAIAAPVINWLFSMLFRFAMKLTGKKEPELYG